MADKNVTCKAEGKIGNSVQQDPNFVGWLDQEAHPGSPAGGGGPGGFTQGHTDVTDDATMPAGTTPGPLQFVPMNTDEQEPEKPPPPTVPESLGSKAAAANDFMDVSIDAKILADGKAKSGVHTGFTQPGPKAPGFSTDDDGLIKEFKAKFVWKGTIAIQTVYGSDTKAEQVSCYGRGTTKDDVRTGNISLGFHEHQHQLDFKNFLSNNSLPELPAMRIKMTPTEYSNETTRFKDELDEFWAAMKADTLANTDEVGYHKSTSETENDCYPHLAR